MATRINWFGGHMARTVRELKVLSGMSCPELRLPLGAALTQHHFRFVPVQFTQVQRSQDRLRLVDLVLEVRDARIPLSSNNPELSNLVQHKRRLIVLNKTDLAAPDKQQVSPFPPHIAKYFLHWVLPTWHLMFVPLLLKWLPAYLQVSNVHLSENTAVERNKRW